MVNADEGIRFYGERVMGQWQFDPKIDQIREALARARGRALAWTPTYGPEPTWQIGVAAVMAIYENALHEAGCDGCAVKTEIDNPIHIYRDSTGRLVTADFELNKITHRLRFADEDAFSARVIIEPK